MFSQMLIFFLTDPDWYYSDFNDNFKEVFDHILIMFSQMLIFFLTHPTLILMIILKMFLIMF